jgi:hypothetical protein
MRAPRRSGGLHTTAMSKPDKLKAARPQVFTNDVFRDDGTIKPGQNFVDQINETIHHSLSINEILEKHQRGSLPSLDDTLKALTSGLPDDYEGIAAALSCITHAYRQHIAEQLCPALNARIQAMPHDTYEQKKELAAWVNAELGRFGLAVKCPKTGLPAKLHGDTGNYPEIGRFQFQVSTDSGRPHRTFNTPDLPVLELVDSTPALDTQVAWKTQVGLKSSRQGRKLS